LFSFIEAAFTRLTGCRQSQFSNSQELTDRLRTEAVSFAHRLENEWSTVAKDLLDFYSVQKEDGISYGRDLGGMKLVLGGGSRLTGTHLQGVRATLLYADTVLIPDPVLPWLETERSLSGHPKPANDGHLKTGQ
ncbi:MAG: hypothetical protein ABIO24_03445, partial [Saprospiraceae bacterium]